MGEIKIHLKVIALFFSALILFQGCTVYKSKPSNLKEAYNHYNKVKIKTNDSKTLKFNRVAFYQGDYYGVLKRTTSTSSFDEHILIDKNNVNSIRLKNKPLSTILSIGTPIVILGLIIGITFSNMSFNWNFDGNRIR